MDSQYGIAGTNPDGRVDIDEDFQHLFDVMKQSSFRHSKGIAGEQPFYIYDYPPECELEVDRHIPWLMQKLQTMEPEQEDDYAPVVRRVDLYDVVLGILKRRKILDRVLKIEPRYHAVASSNASQDKFLGMLESILGADSKQLPNAVVEACMHPETADNNGDDSNAEYSNTVKPGIIFITGVGAVYPYVRAHTLLNTLQGMIEDIPVVLFYPGTFQSSATVGSTMTLFNCLEPDNYYRVMRTRDLNVPVGE